MPVTIDYRQAGIGGSNDRLERVGAADLGRDQRRHPDACRLFHRAHSAVALATFLDLFDPDHRRADAADLADPGVVGQRVERQDTDLGASPQQLAGAQHADIGVAATAGAEQRGADRERRQVILCEEVPLIRHAVHRRP